MRVNLATHILSHSVAVGISYLVSFGKLRQEATATFDFIDLFDKIFNTFNNCSDMSSQQYRQAFSQESGDKVLPTFI